MRALQLNAEAERKRIVEFIREQVHGARYERAVVGLSGGVDSSLAAALCAEALGAENVKGLILPYCTSNPESEAHARQVACWLGIPVERFEITAMVRPLLEARPMMDSRRLGNVMARCRMIVLYDESVAFQGLVVGTSNRTEWLLGYFTLGGDGLAAFEVLGHLYKCQVRQLAAHVGVPEEIIFKAPSADLWKGQTDEGELGFTYNQADQVLYLLTERGLAPEEIPARLAAEGGESVTLDLVEAIRRRMLLTAFKRRLPPFLSTEGRRALL
ncbi:MAG: NAD+ synthase [Chloroflexi bacterium]|nr:NAD+ synthase [Chloroflexota bacterium]